MEDLFLIWINYVVVTKKRVDGQFFLSASNSRSLYDRRSEELIISYVKTLRFTVGIINKSLIIPTDDLRLTSFGPNDIDNINEVAEINFGLLSKKMKID